MDNFFANNWFNIFTVSCLIGSSLVHYGISKQRRTQDTEAITDLKDTLKEEVEKMEKFTRHEVEILTNGHVSNASAIQAHVNNSDAHVTSMLLELLRTRHEFVSQQLSDARQDVQRIEQMLARTTAT